jgi:hypothetical protein
MERSGMAGGRPIMRQGPFPRVKAFIGPLPADRSGIEFTTPIRPDEGSPPGYAYWAQGSPGVEIIEKNELVAIPVTILKRQD